MAVWCRCVEGCLIYFVVRIGTIRIILCARRYGTARWSAQYDGEVHHHAAGVSEKTAGWQQNFQFTK